MSAQARLLNSIRWNLFKWMSGIGWKVCPEPQRSDLQRRLKLGGSPEWKDLP